MLSELARRLCFDLLFHTTDGIGRKVFAVLDGATMQVLPDQLEEHEAEHDCLFRGETDPLVFTRAPYLVEVGPDTSLAEWLVGEGWGLHWGVFVLADEKAVFDDVLEHLRGLLEVRLPDDRVVFFRFYDPRVWEPFAPTCSAEQAAELLGPLQGFACESSDGKTLLVDEALEGKFQRTAHSLTA